MQNAKSCYRVNTNLLNRTCTSSIPSLQLWASTDVILYSFVLCDEFSELHECDLSDDVVARRRLQEEEGIRKAQLEIAAEGGGGGGDAGDDDGEVEDEGKRKPEKKAKKERRKTAEPKEDKVKG